MEYHELNSDPVTELSVDEALQVAVQLHRLRELDNAELLYERILAAVPSHPDAVHFLGILLHQRGRNDEALQRIDTSIAIDPSADRHNNLGNVFLELERHADAEAAFRQALFLEPGHANATNNLGALLRAQGRTDEARAAYLRAIELDPTHVDAYNNLGNLLAATGDVQQAVACYCKAIALTPGHPQARKFLGVAYYTLGEIDKAAAVFREWLDNEPDNPVALHLHAASSGQNVPARASDAYVETTFDGFAASFDAKLGKLGYRAPDLVASALGRACGAPTARWRILDAGCGTGLCGPLVAGHACRIVGVDLSSAMLDRARARRAYDELVKTELQSWLDAHACAYDIVVSADTLVYFGPLDRVFAAARHALAPGGLLIFTVEQMDVDTDAGFQINPHGRYSHSRPYVDRALAMAGFEVNSIDAAELRMEGGQPVRGLVVTARTPAVAGGSSPEMPGDAVESNQSNDGVVPVAAQLQGAQHA